MTGVQPRIGGWAQRVQMLRHWDLKAFEGGPPYNCVNLIQLLAW